MKTYWDLSEKERAALSRDEVAQYLDAELMMSGVLKVAPLTEQPEPAIPEPSATWYRVKHSGYRELSIAFPTVEAAQAFIAAGGAEVETVWMGGSGSASYVSPLHDPSVAAVKIMTSTEKDLASGELKEAGAVRAANEKAREEHRKALAAQEAALSGLWEDWQNCREKAARMNRVAATLVEYTRIADDEDTAIKFLSKAFTTETLCEAEEWFGRMFTIARVAVDDDEDKDLAAS